MAVRNHITGKRLFWSLMAALIVVTFAFILRPEPVWVDLSTAQRGPLEVTVLEEGKTRVKDRYLVSSPVTGFVHRLELDVGDTVIPGELLTLIDPMPASILDARSRAEAEARVAAARSALQSIRQKAAAAEADADFSQQEYQRLLALKPSSFVSDEQLQQARTTAARAQAILRSARFDEEVASHELAAAQTRLQVSSAANGGKPAERVAVRSPIHGAVLGLVRKSEGIVQAGEPLLELGDPGTLEVVVDVLSFDAVKLEPGLATRLTGWGGPTLDAVIRRVEPVGFQDVSALGVEEQRVKVIADMLSPHEHWQLLGDGYRVDAEFILWQAEDTLQVPASALFRHNNGYAVFKVTGDRANIQPVETGPGNGLSTVILSGLNEGDRVVRHPGRGLDDGDRIRVR
ncbi:MULTISPECIES: efflux RND transporter periplasmic adaptor subunit [unclassified Marinobacter]|jgi:HlyD family secretion protein|uniref:Membrane protein n=1 Tax=Marinobacter nauticus TaxID=2743 RepID=A0A455WEY5_MARNT|nr:MULTISPECIES: HlyD family efflux transporter periplasmic adaptor subunit [unclassified Marinobacter]QFS87401.1 Macrolide export protein MacA [Marinobacter sp. THAF197a]QFT51185.1 Macrolide export protein MacA [Marinobacter sp. THAF39]BBJ04392.1 membrane protein [Marinobacter nauticus]